MKTFKLMLIQLGSLLILIPVLLYWIVAGLWEDWRTPNSNRKRKYAESKEDLSEVGNDYLKDINSRGGVSPGLTL